MIVSSPASTHEAALTLLLRQGECSAAELAAQLAISVQVMRRHLRSLEEKGLVEASPQTLGRGRPSNRWRLTSAGRGHFPDGSEHFALGLLQSLSQSLSSNEVQALLYNQAERQANSYRLLIGTGALGQRLEKLVELRRKEGYVADCEAEPGGRSWMLQEYHCSVLRVAEAFPVICDQELQLMRHTFPDCAVERVHWKLEGGHACGFRLEPLR